MSDITDIKNSGYNIVRVYSTDCDTLPNVGDACAANGIKIILGIFIGEVGCDNALSHVSDQIAALKAFNHFDIVELVVIGNEAVFNGFCSIDQLKSLIVTVKTELSSVGYTGPCTTTEVVSTWLGSGMSELCSVIDVIACNAHAFFNGGVTPDGAGQFVAGQLSQVEAVCNLPGYVMETGWPHDGSCNNMSCPSKENQATAIASIVSAIGEKCILFAATDELWKDPGQFGCERSWGVGAISS